jgi:hypothetical protein
LSRWITSPEPRPFVLSPSAAGRTFHLTNPDPISLTEVYETVASLGHPIQQTTYDEWLREAAEFSKRFPKNPLAPFMPFLRRDVMLRLGTARTQLRIECRETLEALKGSGLSCPPPQDLLKRLLKYFKESRFLEDLP